MKYHLYILILLFTLKLSAQPFFGLTIDEKFGLHKNRIGSSFYFQNKHHGKFGMSINYNYATYTYPSDIAHINNTGTGYVSERMGTPPYWKDLGLNNKSIINGLDIEVFNNTRLNTFKNSNLDLKISLGFSRLVDTYTTEHFGEKRTNNFSFNGLLCNMYVTYLIWYKKIGIEPLIGLAYYYPLLGRNFYLPENPFVATELEAGVSFYYQKNKKYQQ